MLLLEIRALKGQMRSYERRTSLALTFNWALPSPALRAVSWEPQSQPELLHPKTAPISLKGCASEAATVLLACGPDLSYRAFCSFVCFIGDLRHFPKIEKSKNVVTRGSHQITSRPDLRCGYFHTNIHEVLVWESHSFLTVLNTELVLDIGSVQGIVFVISVPTAEKSQE